MLFSLHASRQAAPRPAPCSPHHSSRPSTSSSTNAGKLDLQELGNLTVEARFARRGYAMKSKDTPATRRWHRLRAIFVVAMAIALFAPGTGAGGNIGTEQADVAVAANLPNMAAPVYQGTGEYDLCDLLPVGPGLQLLPGPEGGQYECGVSNSGARRKFLHFSIKKKFSIEVAHREITDHAAPCCPEPVPKGQHRICPAERRACGRSHNPSTIPGRSQHAHGPGSVRALLDARLG